MNSQKQSTLQLPTNCTICGAPIEQNERVHRIGNGEELACHGCFTEIGGV